MVTWDDMILIENPNGDYAEGTSDTEPKPQEISDLFKYDNLEITNIQIWFDNLQHFWRWSCDIVD